MDYALLFGQQADKVVVKNNGGSTYREVSLGDGVVTRCKGDTGFDECVSIDTSNGGGTTDCALLSAARTLLLTRSCGIGGIGPHVMLEVVMNELGEHVARNAVPPRDWPALREVVVQRVQEEAFPACDTFDSDMRDFIASRMRPERLKKLQSMAAMPRLPVGRCLD